MRRWRRAVTERGESYNEVYDGFRSELPERVNIGVSACDRHADGSGRRAQDWPGRSALLSVRAWRIIRRRGRSSLSPSCR
jgi:hypothetical protein